LPSQRLFWWAGAVGGVAATVAMECGWVVTEVGRQPWVVYGLQRTAQAATTNGGVVITLSLIVVLYAALGTATIAILRLLARRWRGGGNWEEAVPYGPSEELARTGS
jgi:cytochrome d ubiquinol oxidase subunit I